MSSVLTIARNPVARVFRTRKARMKPRSNFDRASQIVNHWIDTAECRDLRCGQVGLEFFGLIEVSVEKNGETFHSVLEYRECRLGDEHHGELLAEADKANRRYRACGIGAIQVVRRISIFCAE